MYIRKSCCSCRLLLAVGILLLTFRKNLISLQLVSSHSQSGGGNGLPRHTRVTRPSDWSLASAPASHWLMVWPLVSGQSPAPGLLLSRHKEQISILYTRSNEKLQKTASHSSLYFEHKMTEWYPVIIWASIIIRQPAGWRVTMRLIVWLFWQFRTHY